MFKLLFISTFLFSSALMAETKKISIVMTDQEFVQNSEQLVNDLKAALMGKLKDEMTKNGAVSAVEFCNTNAAPLAKATAGDRIAQLSFGRSSHKVRNEKNHPSDWIRPYLTQFQNTFAGDKKLDGAIPQVIKVKNKRAYLSPLYVNAQCLVCHGEAVAQPIQQKIAQLYPKDQAQGFKLNEFRGFFWVMEK